STKVDESKVCDIPIVCEFPKVSSKELIGLHEVKEEARVAFEDEFGAAKEREVLCEAQQGSDNSVVMREARVKMLAYTKREGDCLYDATTRDSCGERHDSRYELRRGEGLNMRQRRWMELFSDYGCETKYHMGKANIVVDAWRRKGGVKPRRVRDICRTIQAEINEKMLVDEIRESKMIRLKMEQEMTKVVVIKERLKEAKDRQERVKLIVRNQTFRI
nr:putative reverse transcriptase domain-containing protein [Tanacetum cinerariifolium]